MAFPKPLPKFNIYSYAVEDNCNGKLLPPQHEALQRLQKFFDENRTGRIGLISMPTGSGKSGIISCLPYFLGKSGLHLSPEPGAIPYGEPFHRFDKPVLVIAPDLTIASQLERSLLVSADAPGENFLLQRNIVPEEDQSVLPNGEKIQDTSHILKPLFLRSNEVIIANAQKFLKDNWEDALPDDIFKLVIIDEAHHHPASTWRRIVQKFKNHAMVAFFTATPYRGDGQRVLDDRDGEEVYHLSLEEARNQRIIRRVKWDPLKLHSDEEDISSIFTLILEEVKKIQEEKDQDNPLPDNIPHMAIAITENIAYAEQVAEMWYNRWGNYGSAIAYHSDLPKRINQAMMQAIRSNKVKLLVVVGKLLEGFDHPPISIAAIMTKIDSPVKFAQFIGRAQRIVRGGKDPESEDIWADVITHSFFKQGENYRAYEEALLIKAD